MVMFVQKNIVRFKMKKAIIVFQNQNKSIKKYSEEIADFLLIRGLSAELIPINNFKPDNLSGADYLLLSSWKNGSLLSFSKPDSEWENFVNNLPSLNGIKTAIFTTYKIFAQTVLRKMKRSLSSKTSEVEFSITSGDGSLSVADKMTLNEFIR